MKIAILTSGILPVPAVQGGAVENLIDFYLAYNDKYHSLDILDKAIVYLHVFLQDFDTDTHRHLIHNVLK